MIRSRKPTALDEILSGAAAERIVLEEFRPLAESLDWELGQLYYKLRGSQAFLSRDVPYVVTNDGFLSSLAAHVLFDSLTGEERRGALDSRTEIRVLEVGAGLGLFCRLFLDAFLALCTEHGRNYYDRLCYFVTDGSTRTVDELSSSGVLARHAGRYRTQTLDVRRPGSAAEQFGQLNAVFANYLLDCLPAAILSFDGPECSQLNVRTSMRMGSADEDSIRSRIAEVRRQPHTDDPSWQRAILDLYELLSLECRFDRVDASQLPYPAQAAALAGGGGIALHSYGALECLQTAFGWLAPRGLLIAADYGFAEGAYTPTAIPYQRYGGSTQIGVNFAQLRSYFRERPECDWIEPDGDNSHIYVRLLGSGVDETTKGSFLNRASKVAFEWKDAPVAAARDLAKEGRRQAAAWAYREAHQRQPYNWVLLGEIARFMLAMQGDPRAAAEIAALALDLNPLDPGLWNLVGDSHFAQGNHAEARRSFERALSLYPGDARTRLNLVYSLVKANELEGALRMIAEGLAADTDGELHTRLLERQAEILAEMARRREQRRGKLVDRLTGPDPFSFYN